MSAKAIVSRFTDNIISCPDWASIVKEWDLLPSPIHRRNDEGESHRQGWIFRGHKRESYPLQPSIERACPSVDWAEAEYKILREFQAKAPMHMDPARLPKPKGKHKLSWLALMQHNGAPTRLLDFTYSPYVALYFALRNRGEDVADYAEVWGFDLAQLVKRSERIGGEAERKARKRQGKPTGGRVGFGAEDFSSALQSAQKEDEEWERVMGHALHPEGVRRTHYGRNGMICIALPPIQNARLSSQQGLFLFNAAANLTFEVSLEHMMRGCKEEWYRRYRIPAGALAMIEERLFALNIHDLSLFPDAEGLAGFVRQKLRLYY